MSNPWFSDPNTFGALYGGIVGGVGGALFGLFAALASYLAVRCKGRRLVKTVLFIFILFGIGNLIAGTLAIFQDQPYGIYYPFLLVGGLFTPLSIIFIFVYNHRYDQAEKQRLAAEEFRKS